ncbi:MFS transporter [Providencia alcalifaciens]|uniref:MFS transporter n=1 Tax=Providencia alcalifaciens TaxID=126385 RepID=UPI0012B508FA|nr:MFS transporter [Providencia alcalifaciens]MTC55037.1 MFS transporter [Providencia alcalifaciens]
MKINLPLFALALGAFGIGTTEFSPMGLLPVIANSTGVSIPVAGMLITAYAVGVMVGAPVMTLLLSHQARRKALIILMSIFTLGNVLSALAPNYEFLLLSRILTSLNHGAFFGLGAVVAASVVPVEKQSSAIATMFMGLTIANIGGVPAATWIGNTIGWRSSFLITAGLGVITMIFLWISLPKGNAGVHPNVKQELSVLMRPQVLLALLTTALGAGAMFTLYTYIAPVLEYLADASTGVMTVMLVLIGVGFSIGNYLGGKFSDRSVDGTLKGFLLLLAAIMLLMPFIAQNSIGAAFAMVIWGAATFGVVPPLQMRVMRVASEAPGLASSVNIGAFNLGNAIGAVAGGAVISGGLSYAYVPVMGAIIAALALIIVLINAHQQKTQTN